MVLILSVAWLFLVIALLARAVLQFRAYRILAPSCPPTQTPSLRVVVPARNEAANISACIRGLTTQDYPGDRLEMVVVDDGSTDGTAELARCAAAGQPGFRVSEAGPLPSGWTGKSHACWRGAQGSRSEWLCFMDADTVASPGLLGAAVAWAEEQKIDLLSLEPEQELGSFWERIILPGGMFMLAFFASDLRAINDPASPDAAANGQFMLIRRKIYEAAGGHAAVSSDISEDTALARRVKEGGHRTRLMGGGRLIRVRMYTDLRGIWEGLSKNAVNMVSSRSMALALALVGLLFGWAAVLLPLGTGAAAILGEVSSMSFAAAATGSLILLGTHMSGARYFRIPVWYGLLFPLGYTLVSAIVINSVRSYRQGEVRWKGRTYAPEPGAGQPKVQPAVGQGERG